MFVFRCVDATPRRRSSPRINAHADDWSSCPGCSEAPRRRVAATVTASAIFCRSLQRSLYWGTLQVCQCGSAKSGPVARIGHGWCGMCSFVVRVVSVHPDIKPLGQSRPNRSGRNQQIIYDSTESVRGEPYGLAVSLSRTGPKRWSRCRCL